jgi:hypothetical protein
MLKKITAVLVLLIVGFFVAVLVQPATFHVNRSIAVAAPIAAVFEKVNDHKKFQEWSPWAELDPNAKYTFEGPATGQGSIMRWAGNENVGEGSLMIVESDPSRGVKQKLAFIKPFASECDVAIELRAEGENKTRVTWSMNGKNDFMGKVMCLFMNMDEMIGDMYDKGLATLKSQVEAKPDSSI